MSIDEIKNIGDDWDIQVFGAEGSVTVTAPEYQSPTSYAGSEPRELASAPVYPVLGPDENEEQVLGI